MRKAWFCYERWTSAQWSPVIYYDEKPENLPKEQLSNRTDLIEMIVDGVYFDEGEVNFGRIKQDFPPPDKPANLPVIPEDEKSQGIDI
jgi:hypothetical protein